MPAGADPLVFTFIALIPPLPWRIRCGFLQLICDVLLAVRVCHVQVLVEVRILARGMVWVLSWRKLRLTGGRIWLVRTQLRLIASLTGSCHRLVRGSESEVSELRVDVEVVSSSS